jgi:hypothetical protein
MHEKFLYDLGDRSFVEALGVYKAEASTGSQGNTIDVRVKSSTRPLLLVLSSSEAVRWNLSLDVGAKLSAILISGSASQTLAGIAGVRVIELGRTNAYEDANLAPLQREVVRKIGRPVDRFQGKYQARTFTAGGFQ